MKFIQFIFSFLFVRDWHTGRHELSRPRLAILSAGLFLVVLGVLIIAIVQAPASYQV